MNQRRFQHPAKPFCWSFFVKTVNDCQWLAIFAKKVSSRMFQDTLYQTLQKIILRITESFHESCKSRSPFLQRLQSLTPIFDRKSTSLKSIFPGTFPKFLKQIFSENASASFLAAFTTQPRNTNYPKNDGINDVRQWELYLLEINRQKCFGQKL